MPDVLLGLVGILVAVTIGAAIEYYRQLRRAQKEYEKARGAIEDIILSFNRQFKSESGKLEVIAYKVEAVDAKTGGFSNRVGEIEKKVIALEANSATNSGDKQKMRTLLDEVDQKIRGAVASQEMLNAKITNLENQITQFAITPEAKIEAAIPIKREKALAHLTETEVAVLELLVSEGPKTAPEIKEKVGLSREHTARLMKNLYEEGYLERETGKIPFKYSVKKEMEKLLKKTESMAT